MTTIDQDRLARLLSPDVHLRSGKGAGANGTVDLCVLQATDWLVGGAGTSDAPKCVDPCLRTFAMRLNDSPMFAEWRDELKPFAARLANTNQGVALTKKRMFACADWAVREIAPLALEKRHPEIAARLRAVPEIVDESTALAAGKVAQVAALAATAAYAAAYAPAYAASASAHATYHAYVADHAVADHAAAVTAYAASVAGDRPVWDAALAFLGRLCDMSSEDTK